MSASKFTPKVRGGLIERTSAGVSLPDAARAVGGGVAKCLGDCAAEEVEWLRDEARRQVEASRAWLDWYRDF